MKKKTLTGVSVLVVKGTIQDATAKSRRAAELREGRRSCGSDGPDARLMVCRMPDGRLEAAPKICLEALLLLEDSGGADLTHACLGCAVAFTEL